MSLKFKLFLFAILLQITTLAQQKLNLDEMFQTSQNKYELKQYKQANTILDFILEADSTYYKAYIGKASISVAERQYRTAVLNANWALEYQADNIEALCIKAEALARMRDLKGALEIYQSILDREPKSVEAINGLALIDYRQKKYKDAVQKLSKALKYDSKHKETLYNLASAYFKLKDFSRSAKYCNKTQKIDPDYRSESVYTIRGHCNNRLNNPVGAILDFREGLKLNPNNSSLYNNIALIFSKQGKYDKAIKYLDASIKIYSKSSVSYYNRGMAYNSLGKYEEAYSDFKKACDLGGSEDARGYYQSLKKKLKK